MTIVVLSPLTGWAGPLAEVPDEAFGAGVLGEGVAVDPTEGLLRAPCDGEVLTVAPTGHALALRGETGAEILMHVGVDSVALKGEGFRTCVAVGERVRAGDRLVVFDLDVVARRARSLITPVLLTNPDRFEIVRRAAGRVRAGDVLMELCERSGAAPDAAPTSTLERTSERFACGLAEGVHARPAARIVAAARETGVDITVQAHGRSASALSVLGLMGLEIGRGDAVTLEAAGPHGGAALAAVARALEATPLSSSGEAPAAPQSPPGEFWGTRGSGGIAVGPAFHRRVAVIEPPAFGRGAGIEAAALEAAVTAVRRRLGEGAGRAGGPGGDIFAAHAILLGDPALHDEAARLLHGGASAGAAWRGAIRRQADLFAAARDPRLRERRADLLDLERQVLTELHGAPEAAPPPPGAIVLAQDLLPSDLAALADGAVAGIAMCGGGATSHVAIMAAALGLPLLAAVPGLEAVPDGARVILDADAGRLIVEPDAAALADAEDRIARRARRRAAATADAGQPCLTADGVRIAVYANLGGADEAERAIAEGAEGCGLLRSEFLFVDRPSPPDEEEQLAAYQAVADRLGGRPLTIRTLDIGADKPARYLTLPPEGNPALGMRGVRVSLQHPDLLRAQLRAILRVRGAVSVLVPMVASTHEAASVRALLEAEAAALGVAAPPLGVMVETPAAALTVAALSAVSDFFSIGANDLTQYALAMDRVLPALAAAFDGLHPAVVALMRGAAHAAVERGRPISVCGGLAADRAAVPLLIGLGVTALSTPPDQVAETKMLVRSLSAADCRAFAGAAGGFEDAAALRRAAAERWPQIAEAP